VALVALLQLGGDELGAGAADHIVLEAAHQLVRQLLVAGETAGLQDRGADGEVLAGELDALLDGPGRVADFEAQVPQRVEHVLDHALGVGGLLVGAQEQQIDVGERRQRAAAVAADADQRQPLTLGGVAGAEHVDGGEVVERGDHLVGDAGEQPGGLDAAGAVLQPLLGDHPAAKQRRLQDVEGGLALRRFVAGILQRRRRQLGAQPHAIDDVFQAGGFEAGRHLRPRDIGRIGGVRRRDSAFPRAGAGLCPPAHVPHRPRPMSKGSYRGGSSTMGWNANHYVAPSLTGRTRKGRALIRDLTARTAQSQVAAAEQDARTRKLHGLAPPRGRASVAKATAASVGKSGVADAVRKRRKDNARPAFTVTVVRRKRKS
jgi:hypothetical protein